MALAQRHERRREQRPRGGRERRDPDRAADERRGGLELGLGRLEVVEDALRAAHEAAAGLGQRDPAAAAVEQRDPGLALERRELLRDGGRRVGERARGGGDRAAGGDLAQERRGGGRTSSIVSTAYGMHKES